VLKAYLKKRINKYKNLIELIERALGKKVPENNDDAKHLTYIEKSQFAALITIFPQVSTLI